LNHSRITKEALQSYILDQCLYHNTHRHSITHADRQTAGHLANNSTSGLPQRLSVSLL